jgi:hypothetical protein
MTTYLGDRTPLPALGRRILRSRSCRGSQASPGGRAGSGR